MYRLPGAFQFPTPPLKHGSVCSQSPTCRPYPVSCEDVLMFPSVGSYRLGTMATQIKKWLFTLMLSGLELYFYYQNCKLGMM